MVNDRPRTLVLGLDGGTFDLLDRLTADGTMPWLRELTRRGYRAPLASVFPPKTIPAWYSFATGLDPGSLGIFGFTAPDGGPGRSRLVESYRPHEAIWDRLSRHGYSVGVVNFPVRHAHALHGFFVPGMLSDSPNPYPADLREAMAERLGEPLVPELPAYREADRAGWMALAQRAVTQRGRIVPWLIERHRPDFLFVLFRETDRIQHQHWASLAGTAPLPSDLGGFFRAVDSACAEIHRAFEDAGGPSRTLVVSDHGLGRAEADFFTNRWLAEQGFLSFRRSRAGWRRRATSRLLLWTEHLGPLRSVVGTVADRLRGSPRRERVGRWLTGEGSFEAMAKHIDWERTVAFSYPVPEGIYLNRWNRHLTAEQAQRAVAAIATGLQRFPEARIEVFRPQEIYRGRQFRDAPALLLRVDGLATEPRMDFSYPEPMLRHRPGFFYGSGVHRMDGILIAAGPGIVPGREERPRSILDVAPTVLQTMGVPIPAELPGEPFTQRLGGPAR